MNHKFEEAFPKGRVVLQHYHNNDWLVHQEFCFYWKEMDITLCVWAEFITDHASTPSFIPDFIIDNTGPISNGATVHDLYYTLLSHSVGIPFRCIYDMLGGQYLSKVDADRMFDAANTATNEMNWLQRYLARYVKYNSGAEDRWMPREEWDRQVALL